MNTLLDLLYTNVDDLYRLSNIKELEKEAQQVYAYTKKFAVGSPSVNYATGLDKYLPKPSFEEIQYAQTNIENKFDYLSFNDFVQYRNLKQKLQRDIIWDIDKAVFTPEGYETKQYSPWVKAPLNFGTSGADRIQRINHSYTDRQYPLRNNAGTYANVDYFESAFWVAATSNGGVIKTEAVSIPVNKSFFLRAKHFDTQGRPLDVKIYTGTISLQDTFDNNNLTWNGLTLTPYDSLDPVNFNIENATDPDYYDLIIDLVGSQLDPSPLYTFFLVCVGSDYVPDTTRSSLAISGTSITVKTSILQFIDDIYERTITLPKNYSPTTVRAIYNQNKTRVGLPASTAQGDTVVLVGQTDERENGLYSVNSGSWLKLNPYINNYNFVQSQNFGFTGSSLLFSTTNELFDAKQPDLKVLTNKSSTITEYWANNKNTQFKQISDIDYSGSVFDCFVLNNYTYDVGDRNSRGMTMVDFNKYENRFDCDAVFFTSTDECMGRLFPDDITETGKIYTNNIKGPTRTIGDQYFIVSSPANFAVAEVIGIVPGQYVQVLIKKIFGTLDPTDMKAYRSGYIFGEVELSSPYKFTLERYQSQITEPLLPLLNYLPVIVDFTDKIKLTLIFAKMALDTAAKESRALSVSSQTVNEMSKKYGYTTDFEKFKVFKEFGFIKDFSNYVATEGVKVKPEINFLYDDEEFLEYKYEQVEELSLDVGATSRAQNSITTQDLASQEFDFNYLQQDSLNGEVSTSYIAARPFFSGPNAIYAASDYATRVGIQDTYGGGYETKESFKFNFIKNVDAIIGDIKNNTDEHGAFKLYDNSQFWSGYTGSYISGHIMSKSVIGLDYFDNILNNTVSYDTTHVQYSLGSNNSELVFNGKTLFIPLPATNYNHIIEFVELEAKTVGNVNLNGFLRARLVDLTTFYETNNAQDIKSYCVSNKITAGYLNSDYQKLRFKLEDIANFQDREEMGQNLFLAIEKSGDFGPGYLVFKCANTKAANLYQNVSGSQINTNLALASTAAITTGSSIYKLFEYLGQPTFATSDVNYPSYFSVETLRFPYSNNPDSTSYNSSQDYINVIIRNPSGSSTQAKIPLTSALGLNTYTFQVPTTLGGTQKTISFGQSGPTINQKPEGYHFLFSVRQSTPDAIPSCYIELENNFVYDTCMTPVLTLYASHNSVVVTSNAGPDDAVFLSSDKQGITSNIPSYNKLNFKNEKRKLTYYLPRATYTGSVVLSGLAEEQTIDNIFSSSIGYSYKRAHLGYSYGMVANTYVGSNNGIEDDASSLEIIASTPMNISRFDGTIYSGADLLQSNIFVNVWSPSGSAFRVESVSGSLIKITNLTTGQYTGPTQGPLLQLSAPMYSGSSNSYLINLYGLPANHTALIQYYSGSQYNTFTTLSGSIFPETIRTTYVNHPDNIAIVDVAVKNTKDKQKFLYKRFSR